MNIKCPSCGSDSIFVLSRTGKKTERQCRICKRWFRSMFDEFADSPEAMAAAFVFSDDDGTTWRSIHSTKVYTKRSDAVMQELEYLTGSEK